MDLHNNEIGRRIAIEHPDASPDELASLVEGAVREGRTVVIGGDGQLAYSDSVPLGGTGEPAAVPVAPGTDPRPLPPPSPDLGAEGGTS